jgi:NAD-dependent deacetylase
MSAPSFPAPLLDALRHARYVTVLTGAGISADSGIPTFRDPQAGLWARFRPEELATPEAFRRNPKRVWDWYAWRRQTVSAAAVNAGHLALAKLEQLVPRFTLVTQNVDGLHAVAGSKSLIELHGNIHRNICFGRDDRANRGCTLGSDPPKCVRCDGYVRPDVVWFGEALPQEAIACAEEAARSCDLFCSIGTSAAVFPAAALPVTALRAGATVIEVNRDPTPLSAAATHCLLGRAAEILPRLIDEAFPSH